MLFGGNPLPERPMWLRLLTVAMVLSVAWPLIRPTLVSLQDQFFKMSAADTEVYLGVYPLPNTSIGPDRNVHCGPGSGSWDYHCTFLYRDGKHRGTVGVRVGHNYLKSVSAPRMLEPDHAGTMRSTRP